MLEQIRSEFMSVGYWPVEVLLIRVGGALLLCGLIGLERETKNHPAGLRTHMLVGLASTVYCLLMLELVQRTGELPDSVRMDPIRVIEAVTGGVAFLAAGLIVFAKGEIKGLTTGASLWLAASVGLCCGLGLWALALIATVPALAINRLLKIVEDKTL
ncbi:MgtC/SapB family protein [Chachezhania antarctica]|uniref:MgtC/SapB family protein n=1 Tax=Chachezhania antarctica TaxID=2340860 RepID=UPI000EAEC24F|nr:MgtC/SapB family protein [Chachezhania antarctica]|tara:strand:- start:2667 stop:3140 length:474 start_codon:yes stop_codon:yes gene_type:complete